MSDYNGRIIRPEERRGGVFSGWTHLNGTHPKRARAQVRRAQFLAKLREVHDVNAALIACDISLATYQSWRFKSASFRYDADAALSEGVK